MHYRRSLSSGQMFLVFHTQLLGKGHMAIHTTKAREQASSTRQQRITHSDTPTSTQGGMLHTWHPVGTRWKQQSRIPIPSRSHQKLANINGSCKSNACSSGIWLAAGNPQKIGISPCTFTSQQSHQIMQPILSAGLPAAGITQTFPRVIVHGLWQWGRLNIPNLFTEQAVMHIHIMMKYGGQSTEMMGSLL